jgi:hydrogenase maturation protease
MATERSVPNTKLLVIGYGNTLRSDDAVGPKVAEAIEALHLAGVRTITCGILTPELADPISKAGSVVFVDASLEDAGGVKLRELSPADSAQVFAHAADPRTLLALARDVLGRAPPGWWLTIPTESLAIGEELSTKAQNGIAEAVWIIRKLARSSKNL